MDSIDNHIAKFSIFIDTNILFKSHLRDLILRLSTNNTFQIHWSNDVLDELSRNLLKRIEQDKVDRVLVQMQLAFPDACITGYTTDGILLTASSDKHVVAAAVVGKCDVIITENIKDFPDHELDQYNIEAQLPDNFLLHHYSLEPSKTIQTIREHLRALNNPQISFTTYLDMLISAGVERFAQKLYDDRIGDMLGELK